MRICFLMERTTMYYVHASKTNILYFGGASWLHFLTCFHLKCAKTSNSSLGKQQNCFVVQMWNNPLRHHCLQKHLPHAHCGCATTPLYNPGFPVYTLKKSWPLDHKTLISWVIFYPWYWGGAITVTNRMYLTGLWFHSSLSQSRHLIFSAYREEKTYMKQDCPKVLKLDAGLNRFLEIEVFLCAK